jgi:hypothetical protein
MDDDVVIIDKPSTNMSTNPPNQTNPSNTSQMPNPFYRQTNLSLPNVDGYERKFDGADLKLCSSAVEKSTEDFQPTELSKYFRPNVVESVQSSYVYNKK